MTGGSPERGVPSARRWGDLGLRALSAIVMIAVAVTSALIGGHLFVLVWLAAALAVLWEWQTMVGVPALRVRVWIGALGLTVIAILMRNGAFSATCLLLLLVAALAALLVEGQNRLWTACGALYAGALLIAAVGLRLSPSDGARAILWLFATVWATDTFAYFGGRLIGGPKLAPRISPSKTWSGTLTGIVAGTLIGLFVALWSASRETAVLPVLVITFLASALSQGGDAIESAIKRRFGVKDSSRLIPGHGGVMDRLDGFVAAAVFAFCVGLVRNPHSIASGLFHSV